MFNSPFGGPFGGAFGGGDDARRHDEAGTVPEIFGIPAIVGTGEIGTSHSVAGFVMTGNPIPVVGYSWEVGGVEKSTAPTYIPTVSDIDNAASGFSTGFSTGFAGTAILTCTITATNAAGSSAPIETEGVMLTLPVTGLLSAHIDQSRGRVGDLLTASYVSTGQPDTITYAWLRDGAPISGALGASWVADDAGEVVCDVTATNAEGASETIRTDPIRVFHQQMAGSAVSTAASVKSVVFTGASVEISGQDFLFMVSYEGPVPASIVAEGVTLSTFTDGASATTGGKTLKLLDGDVQDTNKRQYALMLSGVTGTKDIDFEINTTTNHTYLKAVAYQLSGYDDTRAVVTFSAPAATGTLGVTVAKPQNGIVFAMGNRLSAMSGTPPDWTTAYVSNTATSGLDLITGYIYGAAAYQGDITFAQPAPVAAEQVMAVAIPPQGVILPEITSTPTITDGASPVEGVPITLNIASVSAGTEKVLVRVYRSSSPLVAVTNAIEYVIGSAAPAPTYTPTSADVGFQLLQGQTPQAGTRTGVEIFSSVTGAVLAAGALTPPAVLDPSKFTFVGTSASNGGIITSGGVLVQRADTTVKAGITEPAGWKLALLRSLTPGLTRTSTHIDMSNIKVLTDAAPDGLGIAYDGSADVLWRSGNGASDGVTQYLYAWWKHTASGAVYEALAAPKSFVSDTGEVIIIPDPNEPAANQTLSTASSALIISVLQTRISGGSTAEHIIDLPTGNYYGLNIDAMVLPGKTILRSANRALGAVFTSISMARTQNVHFWHVKATVRERSRTTNPSATNNPDAATGAVVYARGSVNCGLDWCEIDCGPNIRRTDAGRTGPGWLDHISYGIDAYEYDSTRRTTNLRVYMNWIHGAAAHAIYFGNAVAPHVEENVFSEICGDDIQMGWTVNATFINNWGSRIKYPSWNPVRSEWIHTDFIQTASFTVLTQNNRYFGNVQMKGDWNAVPGGGWTSIPCQGIFGDRSLITDHVFDNNIIITNTQNSIYFPQVAAGTLARNATTNNTVLKLVDDHYFSTLHQATINIGGASPHSGNVHCTINASADFGTDGLNIRMFTNDYTNVLQWHYSAHMGSSFYEARPIEGTFLHWAYTGASAKRGAWRRWQDVIVLGKYPKKGPAAAAWKTSYDPRNQITS